MGSLCSSYGDHEASPFQEPQRDQADVLDAREAHNAAEGSDARLDCRPLPRRLSRHQVHVISKQRVDMYWRMDLKPMTARLIKFRPPTCQHVR